MALSRNAVDKLGERLRAGSTTEEDWTLLEELRDLRRAHLDLVIGRIRDELALPVTGRVKTTRTLIEKLQREGLRFSQMDDVAGARIRVDGTRMDQDHVVALLASIWPDARVKDRRAQPAHGYRAVHVIPAIERWPLEIQVRTHRQDAVANILERLADTWGRQIRYGGPPDLPDALAPPEEEGPTRGAFLQMAMDLADHIAAVEELRALVEDAEFDDPAPQLDMARIEAEADGLIQQLADMFGRWTRH